MQLLFKVSVFSKKYGTSAVHMCPVFSRSSALQCGNAIKIRGGIMLNFCQAPPHVD